MAAKKTPVIDRTVSDEEEEVVPDWSTGICGCLNIETEAICDWGYFWYSLFPPFLFGYNTLTMMETAPGEKYYACDGPCVKCPNTFHACFHAAVCTVCPGIAAQQRGRIRKQAGIPGHLAHDIISHCCCGPCALAQEARQMDKKGYSGASIVPVPFWRSLVVPLTKRDARLSEAAQRGSIEGCTILLTAKANINVRNAVQRTPLMNAAFGGHTLLCEFLVQRGANLHAQDRTGSTAVTLAAQAGHGSTVLKLWQLGASVTTVDSFGMGPVDYAKGEALAAIRTITGRK